MKKKLLAITLCFLVLMTTWVIADDQTDLQNKIKEYSNKLVEIRQQKNTLSSQIQYMDTQIYLTQLRIQETEQNIITTQKEIDVLGDRINNLDSSLNQLTEMLRNRVVKEYKERPVSVLTMIIDSTTANDLLAHFKYLKTTQENNQRLIVQVQQQKLNFEEQKTKREEKKKELDNLIVTLDQQKNDLRNQQNAKKNLLIATNSDEIAYQVLLDKARRELAGFTSYTQSRGGGLTTFGKGSNGWYYTQRDPAWGNMTIGNSSYPVWQAGCALTSLAMVCTNYGSNLTPADIASDPSRFVNGDLIDNQNTCPGKSTQFISSPTLEQIKSYVGSGPVILRLYAPSVSGLHFIVAWKWDDGANDFIIHDPYNGPDLKFSSLYSWSQVTIATIIR